MKRRTLAALAGRVLVAPKQPQRVRPVVEPLDDLDAVVPQPIQFLLVVRLQAPRFGGRIFAQIVAALRRQVVADHMLPQARADGGSAAGDVLQTPTMFSNGVTGSHRPGRHWLGRWHPARTRRNNVAQSSRCRDGRGRFKEAASVHGLVAVWRHEGHPAKIGQLRNGPQRQTIGRCLRFCYNGARECRSWRQ